MRPPGLRACTCEEEIHVSWLTLRPLDIPSPSSLEATQLQKLREIGKITSGLCGERWLCESVEQQPKGFCQRKCSTRMDIHWFGNLLVGGVMP